MSYGWNGTPKERYLAILRMICRLFLKDRERSGGVIIIDWDGLYNQADDAFDYWRAWMLRERLAKRHEQILVTGDFRVRKRKGHFTWPWRTRVLYIRPTERGRPSGFVCFVFSHSSYISDLPMDWQYIHYYFSTTEHWLIIQIPHGCWRIIKYGIHDWILTS